MTRWKFLVKMEIGGKGEWMEKRVFFRIIMFSQVS